MFGSSLGTSPCKVDTFTPSLGLQPFFATRPLSTAILAATKLASSAIAALIASGILVIALLFWSLLPVQFGRKTTTMIAAAESLMGARTSAWELLAFAILFVSLWKVGAASACNEVTGRRWLGFIFATSLGVLVLVLPVGWLRFQADPQLFLTWMRHVPTALKGLLGLKLFFAVLGMAILHRGEADNWRFGLWTLSVWTIAVLLLTAAVDALAPLKEIHPSQILGGAALFLPINRILWTPVAMAWNRHR